MSIPEGYYDQSYPPSLWAPVVIPATSATAGTPGNWLPSGSQPPANVASMTGITAVPATPWTVGQYVQTMTFGAPGEATWSGTGWVGGRAPASFEAREAPQAPVVPQDSPEAPAGPETAQEPPGATGTP